MTINAYGEIRNMKPEHFIILTRKGAIRLGEFPFPEWHKREKENILDAVGVKVEYGELLKEAEYRGTFQTVSDREHAQIISLYIEEDLGMRKVAERLNRSSKTIHEHIKKHNMAVERSGFCAPCKRFGSQYYNKIAIREK